MSLYSQLLITGGSGFLGWNLATYAAKEYDVCFTYHQHPFNIRGCQEYHLNLQDPDEIEEVIGEIQPEVIIHTAASANVDVCEKRRSMAYEINVTGTDNLAKCAEDIGARVIYISTDLVFDGKKGNYLESDFPRPVNYYGETKLQGERAVQAACSDYLIIRMALMYGEGNGVNGCFTDWLRDGLKHQKSVPLYTDQYRTPLFVGDGVKAILELLEQPVKNDVFHLAGQERLNRYDFGKHFSHVFEYQEQYLRPTTMTNGGSGASRGSDCSLNTEKIQHCLSFQLADVSTGLQMMKTQQ